MSLQQREMFIRGCTLKRELTVTPNVEHTLSWWQKSFSGLHGMQVTVRDAGGADLPGETFTDVEGMWKDEQIVFTSAHEKVEVEFISNARVGWPGMMLVGKPRQNLLELYWSGMMDTACSFEE